ncbi:hypothetical protein BsWGS_19161 [Bradybaena similaris]
MVPRNDLNTLPVDRGWAFAITAASLISHATMGSASQTNSVLFLEVLGMYNSTITTGSFMFMCSTLLYSISSLTTANFIMPKIKERQCLILGGILCSALSLGASFAPNMGTFVALVSLKGIGHGLIFVPAIALIPHYFKRLRSRASTVPWCGGSAATIIAPFIIRAVRKEYGVSGAYFLLSAFELHYVFAGLLLRQPSSYRYRPDQTDGSAKDNSSPLSTNPITADTKRDGQPEDNASTEYGSKLLQVISEEHAEDAVAASESLLAKPEGKENSDDHVKDTTVAKFREMKDETKDTEYVYRERRNTFYGSVLTLDSDVGAALEFILEDVPDNPSEKSLSRWKKLYRDASLELWSFRWTLLAMLPGSVNMYLVSYIPTISKLQGASLDEAALLVTIMGCVDLASRISAGFITDAKVLSSTKLLSIAMLSIGITCNLFRLATSFVTLVPIIIFIGMFIGMRGPLQALICMEVVGPQKMPQAYSIMATLNTLVSPSFNPLFGLLAEAMGSIVPVMHVIGTGYILCACLLALLPLFVRLDVKHGRKT